MRSLRMRDVAQDACTRMKNQNRAIVHALVCALRICPKCIASWSRLNEGGLEYHDLENARHELLGFTEILAFRDARDIHKPLLEIMQ